MLSLPCSARGLPRWLTRQTPDPLRERRRALRQAGARRRPARRRLRRCVLRAAGVAQGGRSDQSAAAGPGRTRRRSFSMTRHRRCTPFHSRKRCRAVAAAPAVSGASAVGAARAAWNAAGQAADVRRGVAGLYDAVAPRHTEAEFEGVLARLERQASRRRPARLRYEQFKRAFIIPRERLDGVFQAAIRACRDRTRTYVELPTEESFTVEYVTGQVVERLQLVSRQLSQPDSGQHGPADLHRPRARSRVS